MKRFDLTSKAKIAAAALLVAGLSFASMSLPVSAVEDAASTSAVAEGSDLRDQINEINSDVKQKKTDLENLNRKIEEYRALVAKKQIESASLEDELALIDNKVAKEELSIDIARSEIRSLELEIDTLNKRIAADEEQIAEERKLLGGLARKLYRTQMNRGTFEILLANKNFSDFFDALHSITRLQLAVDSTLGKLKVLFDDLQTEKAGRETARQDSLARKRALEVAKMELEDEKALKDELLTKTKSSELEYRYLLADLKHEQSEADSEIIYLEKTLRQKMNIADRLGNSSAVLSWPVVPARGLSSIYHDPDYPFRYVFEHPAIDIRAYQGTPVRSSAAGIVTRAKNAGMGYSYVMIIHNNDLATVYGHLSKITAKEDTFVERGEIIGYSGGMPGTPGAGRMTTGPHLHFETRRGGIPVDPMNYLVAAY
ncbi:MAG: peptidoglycan DD-metalloendopeptidase family protein [Patescibacteria group bacterium]|jgi:murein DD-endopeptidase MepM/ murein hydrolase activator NlpD